LLGSVSYKGLGLARLSVDDPGWLDSKVEDSLDLLLGCTIEACAKGRKETEDFGIWVTFDGYR